jgi:hypothetical protein
MTYYQIVLEDLSREITGETYNITPPYEPHSSFEEKFYLTQKALERARRMGDRTLQLINAFYLGQLLEKETKSQTQRNYYAQQLTAHYRTTVVRIFYIYEVFGVEHLMRSTQTTLTTIRKLSFKEFQQLVLVSAQIFNGVENWRGSDVMAVT